MRVWVLHAVVVYKPSAKVIKITWFWPLTFRQTLSQFWWNLKLRTITRGQKLHLFGQNGKNRHTIPNISASTDWTSPTFQHW